MNKRGTRDIQLATRGAFAGAALFIALIVAFSTAGAGPPSATTLMLIGVLGAASHLVLLPVVAVLPAPVWARAGGYAWIAIDVMLEPQQQGPPKLALNPVALASTRAKTYDGTGLVNSGLMLAPGNPLNFPSSFSLTLTQRGRYEYWCIPHAPLGMRGVVIVM
jgi:hypothetical protein